jgi:DNA-binding response OmpR family regulator
MVTRRPIVLIVDDEPHLRSGLGRILNEEGYETMIAADGETALKLAEEKKPDVVLLDIIMPGMDGREVCRKLREIASEAQIIYLTATAEPSGSLHVKYPRGEADAYIAKPATSKRILSRINNALNTVRLQPTGKGNG